MTPTLTLLKLAWESNLCDAITGSETLKSCVPRLRRTIRGLAARRPARNVPYDIPASGMLLRLELCLSIISLALLFADP